MQLDKLQLDLRPRTNAQALDLGFSLLRAHAGGTYMVWLALWLPLVAICGVLAWFTPEYPGAWVTLAWWLRPMLERAPLYLLSRQVFGEDVSWRAALRAWPKQWGGGWFSMLTWWRPFAVGRSLIQPIWQLEGARGRVAAERRRIIGRNGTSRSAQWFGVACAHFELVLELGLIAFVGIFLSDENSINPFTFFTADAASSHRLATLILSYGSYAFAGGVIGPIYTACGFTLYLNRRATLEAWDLEIALRQIKPPVQRMPGAAAIAASVLAVVLLAANMGLPTAALASEAAATSPAATGKDCPVPQYIKDREASREPDKNPAQAGLRLELARLYANDDLRGYQCKLQWQFKGKQDEPSPRSFPKVGDFSWLASLLEVFLIAALIVLIIWLAYRYRDQFAKLIGRPSASRATEVAGMDIRPESLPDDVAAKVLELWRSGQRRAALALLYRATVSRLVNEDHLPLTQGATEGDCTRLAEQAFRNQKLAAGRLQTVAAITDTWLRAAYADRWPDDTAVAANCAAWRAEFGAGRASKEVSA